MVPGDAHEGTTSLERRVIKRYSNRKLYDTKDSRYVTLLQIAEMIRANEDVQIIDNATKEDKTDVTLALIISEELKSQPRSVPLGTLRDLIHQRGERLLSQLREGPIGRLIPTPAGEGRSSELDEGGAGPDSAPAPSEPAPSSREMPASGSAPGSESKPEGGPFEHWRHAVDERIRMILPSFIGFRDLEQRVEQLNKRVAELEAELARRKP